MLFCFDTRRKEWKAKFKRGSEQFEIELTIDAEPSELHTYISKIETILEDYQRLPEGYLLQRLTEAEKKEGSDSSYLHWSEQDVFDDETFKSHFQIYEWSFELECLEDLEDVKFEVSLDDAEEVYGGHYCYCDAVYHSASKDFTVSDIRIAG